MCALRPQNVNTEVGMLRICNPTLDTGLVVGGVYFYSQTGGGYARTPFSEVREREIIPMRTATW